MGDGRAQHQKLDRPSLCFQPSPPTGAGDDFWFFQVSGLCEEVFFLAPAEPIRS